MKKRNRDKLLWEVLRAMRFQADSRKRAHLQAIGENLIEDYRNMGKRTTRTEIEFQARGPEGRDVNDNDEEPDESDTYLKPMGEQTQTLSAVPQL